VAVQLASCVQGKHQESKLLAGTGTMNALRKCNMVAQRGFDGKMSQCLDPIALVQQDHWWTCDWLDRSPRVVPVRRCTRCAPFQAALARVPVTLGSFPPIPDSIHSPLVVRPVDGGAVLDQLQARGPGLRERLPPRAAVVQEAARQPHPQPQRLQHQRGARTSGSPGVQSP
jgi:hypothetical protein